MSRVHGGTVDLPRVLLNPIAKSFAQNRLRSCNKATFRFGPEQPRPKQSLTSSPSPSFRDIVVLEQNSAESAGLLIAFDGRRHQRGRGRSAILGFSG